MIEALNSFREGSIVNETPLFMLSKKISVGSSYGILV